MTKTVVTRLWLVGLVALVIGLAIGGISLGLMLAYGGTFTPATSGNGYDFIPTINGYFWSTVGFMVAGFAVAAVGGVLQLAAWVGALINTYELENKTWFTILLVAGLIGLAFGLVGFGAMIAYLIAGPRDAPQALPPHTEESSLPRTAPLVHAR